jgi:hypothetical protein
VVNRNCLVDLDDHDAGRKHLEKPAGAGDVPGGGEALGLSAQSTRAPVGHRQARQF